MDSITPCAAASHYINSHLNPPAVTLPRRKPVRQQPEPISRSAPSPLTLPPSAEHNALPSPAPSPPLPVGTTCRRHVSLVPSPSPAEGLPLLGEGPLVGSARRSTCPFPPPRPAPPVPARRLMGVRCVWGGGGGGSDPSPRPVESGAHQVIPAECDAYRHESRQRMPHFWHAQRGKKS